MSAYENYNETSLRYDRARYAIAAPAVLQTLVRVATASLDQLQQSSSSSSSSSSTSTSTSAPPSKADVNAAIAQFATADIGCGTGNYSFVLAEAGVKSVYALDGNEGMLGQLQAKVDTLKQSTDENNSTNNSTAIANKITVGPAFDLRSVWPFIPSHISFQFIWHNFRISHFSIHFLVFCFVCFSSVTQT